MKNPYTVKLSPEQYTDNIAEAPLIRYAKEHGHDGVIFEYDGSKEDLAYDKFYVVFDSAQIKSAMDNIGTFDKTNPDIRYSSQDGRYRDLMGEKAAQYTKGILCAYRKIKKSLSKTGEGFLYRCTIIPITPFKKTMRSDKDTSGTPETIRTSDPSLRRRMLYPLSYWGICLCIVQCFFALVKRAAPVCHLRSAAHRRVFYRRLPGCSASPARSQRRLSQPESARSCCVFCPEKLRSSSSSLPSSLC